MKERDGGKNKEEREKSQIMFASQAAAATAASNSEPTADTGAPTLSALLAAHKRRSSAMRAEQARARAAAGAAVARVGERLALTTNDGVARIFVTQVCFLQLSSSLLQLFS